MGRFAEILRRQRETRGLEQGELAELLGVTQQTVSKWETGVTVPRPARIAALARALGLDAGVLHAAAGDTGDNRMSPEEVTARTGVALDLLSDDELMHLIDDAWSELRRRRDDGRPGRGPLRQP